MSLAGGQLIVLAAENNVTEVRRLLSVGADIESTLCDKTPLFWASYEGHVEVVNVLLSHNGETTSVLGKRKSRAGANTEAKDNSGDTPLHASSTRGHLPVVKALVSGGANLLPANNRGQLPVHQAVIRRHSAVSKYLLQEFYATTRHLPLHQLLKDLTWIVTPDCRFLGVPPLRTALHCNVLGTDDVVEILEYLVGKNPALLSSRDQDGSLPLHVACRLGASFTIIQSLVNVYKASVKSVTPQGDLPLFLACEMSETSLDTIFLLVKQDPEVVYR
jgi:ankyrin repeat protein